MKLNWNTQQAKGTKQTLMYSDWYTILFFELIFFMPASYGVKTTTKQKINFKISQTEIKKVQILYTKILN